MASTRRKIVVRCMAVATVAVLLSGFGWLWVQWPLWTAEEFLQERPPFGFAEPLSVPPKNNPNEFFYAYSMMNTPLDKIDFHDQSASDFVLGRIIFSVSFPYEEYVLESQFGKVRIVSDSSEVIPMYSPVMSATLSDSQIESEP